MLESHEIVEELYRRYAGKDEVLFDISVAYKDNIREIVEATIKILRERKEEKNSFNPHVKAIFSNLKALLDRWKKDEKFARENRRSERAEAIFYCCLDLECTIRALQEEKLIADKAKAKQIRELVNKRIRSLYKKNGSVSRGKLKKYHLNNEPINWGDLSCYQVRITDNGTVKVFIEEAAPDAEEFKAFIKRELNKLGYDSVEVVTEW